MFTFAEQTRKWSLGRVARHRSAKPFTAVRIRQRPQGKSRNPSITGLWDFLVRSSCDSERIKDCNSESIVFAALLATLLSTKSLQVVGKLVIGEGRQAVSSYFLD